MRLDLADLRLFLHVAEAGSITRGAAGASLSLAAASERVRAMEASLGTPLLDRGSRGVRPTPAGEVLARHARTVLDQVEHMRGELARYARDVEGRIRLLGNTAALAEHLPTPLAAFLAAHPGIHVELEERRSAEIAEQLAAGFADLGIAADTADLRGLETVPFRTDRLVLAVPAGDPLAARRHVALAEVADRPFVGLPAGSPLGEYVGRHAARSGTVLRPRVRLHDLNALCRMVAQGVGLAVVPEAAVRRWRRAAGVRAVRLAEPWAQRRLLLCARRLGELPPPAQALAAHLRG